MAITKLPAALYNTSLTASASANTKGAYAELTAASPEAAKAVFISIHDATSGARRFLVDLAIGAAASEVVVVADVPFAPGDQFNTNCPGFYLPLAIPAGSRVAARVACSTGSSVCRIAVHLIGGVGAAVATTYGANAGNSSGTTVDPGATPNTKGAYVELSAAISADIDEVVVIVSGLGNTTPAGAAFSLDIATGPASSEVVVVPDITFSSNAGFDIFNPLTFSAPVAIPSGTRLAARAAASTGDATDRLFTATVIGITNPIVGGTGLTFFTRPGALLRR